MPFDTAGVIRARLETHGLSPTSEEIGALAGYVGLLTKWNKTVNLTSLVLNPLSDEAIDRLLGEPLLAVQFVPDGPQVLLDIGSGSGSPAIPIKIARPDIALAMVESRERKSVFLREAIRQLALRQTDVATERAERLPEDAKFRQGADLISMRAIRADSPLWEVISDLLAPRGRVLWFRSGAAGGPEDLGYADYFELEATHALIAARRSELAILRRAR